MRPLLLLVASPFIVAAFGSFPMPLTGTGVANVTTPTGLCGTAEQLGRVASALPPLEGALK